MSGSASSPYPQNIDPYSPAEGGIDIKALLGILKRRNAANSGWVNLLGAASKVAQRDGRLVAFSG